MQTRGLCSGSVLQERAARASSPVCTGLKREELRATKILFCGQILKEHIVSCYIFGLMF